MISVPWLRPKKELQSFKPVCPNFFYAWNSKRKCLKEKFGQYEEHPHLHSYRPILSLHSKKDKT